MKKNIHCKRLMLIFVFLLLCAGSMAACGGTAMEEPDETDEVEDNTVIKISFSGFTEGEERWQRFLNAVESGQPDKVTIEETLYDKLSVYNVEYRDGMYYYGSEEPISYKYLLKLEGTMPGSGVEASLVILTNEMCDFDEFARRFASSIEPLDYRSVLWFTVQPD